MQYTNTTEKAVKLTIKATDPNTDTTRTREVWVPKSQLDAQGVPGAWITSKKAEEVWGGYQGFRSLEISWIDATGAEFAEGQTAKEAERREAAQAKMSAGLAENQRLLAIAVEAGLASAGRRYKTATLIKKLDEAGIEF